MPIDPSGLESEGRLIAHLRVPRIETEYPGMRPEVRRFVMQVLGSRQHHDDEVVSACLIWINNNGFPKVKPRNTATVWMKSELGKALNNQPYNQDSVGIQVRVSFDALMSEAGPFLTNDEQERFRMFLSAMASKFGVSY